MNDAHLHMLVNHFPIIGLIIGSLILLVGILLNSVVSKKIALTVLLFSAAFALPSFGSGEDAEEVVEHMSTMTEQTHHLIHEHEEKAEFFMPFAWSIMFLSLASLFFEWKKKKFAKYVSILTLIVSLVACYIAREVGTSGGEIAHPEIRKDFKMEQHEEHHD
ncbi:MAG: hypothetical protein V4622_08550 [Bacteroidota bacterium]